MIYIYIYKSIGIDNNKIILFINHFFTSFFLLLYIKNYNYNDIYVYI